MKTNPLFLFIVLFLSASLTMNAQTDKSVSEETAPQTNFVKINLTSVALKNYSLQYERSIKKKLSFAASFRIMPNTGIPFKSWILDAAGDEDPDTKEVIEKFRLSNFAITPELRFYLGKGYGKGFYIAPFYRYASFKTDQLIFTYTSNIIGEEEINLTGKLSSHTGGLLFGAQWFLGRNICLDWWILGPHLGSGRGNFVGISSQPLTPAEQNELRQELEDLDIPFTRKTVTVNANGASLQLDGPWAGLRLGLLIGIRF